MRLRPSRAPVTRLSRRVLLGPGRGRRRRHRRRAVLRAAAAALRPAGSELYNTEQSRRRRTASPPCRATTPAFRKTRPSSGRRCPAISAGRSLMPARRRQGCRAAAGPIPSSSASPRSRRRRAPAISSRRPMSGRPRRLRRFRRPRAIRERRAQRARIDPILTSQDHKLAFLNGDVDRRTVSPDRVEAPASPIRAAGRRGHSRRR